MTDTNLEAFERPFEHPSGVSLDFNYWTKTSYLETENEVCNFIISLLTGDKPHCVKQKHNNAAKVIVVVAQNVESHMITSEKIQKSLFLSKCSSFPINQQLKSELNKYSRGPTTDTLYSTLLWPEKSPITFDAMKYLHSRKLFEDFTLTFQVESLCVYMFMYIRMSVLVSTHIYL